MFRLPSVLLISLLVANCGDNIAEEPIVGQASITPEHYDYFFDLETRQATASLSLRIVQPGNCFSLAMKSEGNSDTTIDGIPVLSALQREGRIEVCGEEGWPEGSIISFQTTTQVPLETWKDSQVGYSVSEDIEGNPFTYLVSWVEGCDRFGPCDPDPSTFATYRFTIQHPEDTQVLCPGTLQISANQTICDFEYEGGPTYSSFGFAASPSWVKVDMGDWGPIHVSFYDMPTAGLAAKFAVEEHKSFTEWMIETFGPYPYGTEMRFAVGPTYWSGFEHPGSIVLNDRLTTGSFNTAYANPLAHTTNHEIAHQWAGDQTTLAGTYDFVWKEAMAEYLVFVHMDEKISDSRASRILNAWNRFSQNSEYYLVPEEAPLLIDYYGDVYGPGPMILFRQIEALFSRQAVLSALQNVLGEQRAIGVEDVKTALEQATGADLSKYFAAWVRGQGAPAWPRFAVETQAEGQGTRVTVTQQNAEATLFGCAFDIVLEGEAAEDRATLRVNLGPDGQASFTELVETDFAVLGFRFDPKQECLGALASSSLAPPPESKFNPMVAPAFR